MTTHKTHSRPVAARLSCLATAAILLCCSQASAGLILAVEYANNFDLGELSSEASTQAAVLAEGNTVTATTNLENAALVNSADSLWISTGSQAQSLTAAEVTNLQDFINSGRRVVIHGENSSWAAWNNSVLAVLGGTPQNNLAGGDQVLPVVGNSNGLTDGITQIRMSFWGDVATGSRIDLIANGGVSVWGPHDNVLLFLDGNWLLTGPGSSNRSSGFVANVGGWLADSAAVPEPTSFAMLGLIGCGLAFQRRRA